MSPRARTPHAINLRYERAMVPAVCVKSLQTSEQMFGEPIGF